MQSIDPLRERVLSHNRKMIRWHAAIAVITLSIGYLNHGFLFNALQGPFAVPLATVENRAELDAKDLRFLLVTFKEVFETGFEQVTEQNGHKTVSGIFIARLQDRSILVQSKGTAQQLIGRPIELHTTSVGSLIEKEVLPGLAKNFEGGVIPPELIRDYMLSDSAYRSEGYIACGMLGGMLLINSFYLFLGVRRSDISAHPVWKQLARVGSPEVLHASFNQELLSAQDLIEIKGKWITGKITLTRSWLIQESWAALVVIPLDDIVWIYKHILIHNGVKSCSLVVYRLSTTKPSTFQVSAFNEEPVDRLIGVILERKPWILSGFDPQLVKMWKKQREAIIRSFESRKAQLKGQTTVAGQRPVMPSTQL